MDVEKVGLIAQKISFAFEDTFVDVDKRKKFVAFFDRYLAALDPSQTMEAYDAIILLSRKNPVEFERMVDDMKKEGLISD